MKLCVCLLHFRTWQCFVKFTDIKNTGKRLAEANLLLLTSHYRTLTKQNRHVSRVLFMINLFSIFGWVVRCFFPRQPASSFY